MHIADVLTQTVAPVLAFMTREGECTRVAVEFAGPPGESELMLRLTLNGEEVSTYLEVPGVDETLDARRARFGSELQDFLAEGVATWGQYRVTLEEAAATQAPG